MRTRSGDSLLAARVQLPMSADTAAQRRRSVQIEVVIRPVVDPKVILTSHSSGIGRRARPRGVSLGGQPDPLSSTRRRDFAGGLFDVRDAQRCAGRDRDGPSGRGSWVETDQPSEDGRRNLLHERGEGI